MCRNVVCENVELSLFIYLKQTDASFGLEIFSFGYYEENVRKILSKQKCFISPVIKFSVKLIIF